MSEKTDDPFAAFKEGQPPTETKTPDKAPKKARKKAVGGKRAGPANGGVPDAAPAPSQGSTESSKKPRKARKARQPRELKLGLSTLLDLGGLNDAENSALVAIATSLNSLPKKSRGRVSAALGKIFA